MDENQTVDKEKNNESSALSKKERREQRREEHAQEIYKDNRRKTAKRALKLALVIAAAGGAIGILIWYAASRAPVSEEEIIARRGLHWHAELVILSKEKRREIPANIGIGVTHNPLHTHDADGIIHMEFDGLVRRDDLRLGRFFEVWQKNFSENEFGKLAKMLVNGAENQDSQTYMMRDGDEIELHYE